MAKKEITSRPGLFGTTNHYDSKGRKVGYSQQGAFGSTAHYDARGCKVGSSQSGAFRTDHYSAKYKTTSGFFGSKKTEFED